MSTLILKIHYRQSATILTPEQIEKIRHLKNKVLAYMIVKEYHINKNWVHDIWNNCEHFQQNGNHFFEELRKIPSILTVLSSPQEQENNHPILGSLNPFHESIEMNAQEKQKKKKKLLKQSLLPKISVGGLYQNSTLDISHDNIFASIKKDHIKSEEVIHELEKFLAFNSPFHYIQIKNTSQGLTEIIC
ncbi:hypothetical protein RclHR1_30970001 [Rhizophagus clarus]|uniref:Uncharacterized protein n=1 Tax=Rhizophagus clarus TaxID=94130 RepID=A0A2Z6R6R9_9GLOM|nr:hypothetical protein RclHR1_30970001 [Rhizophagus clarus]GES83331.1 hypothetical protein RCL_jg16039.t1 [Rhizophagus clarus]